MSMRTSESADRALISVGRAPTLRRRFLCMIYEAMLLFGVLFVAFGAAFVAGYIFDTLSPSRSALLFHQAGALWLFVVLGIYFAWFWMHGGQTLAMKTWRIRVVEADGRPLSLKHAAARYLLCWMFLLPTLGLLGAIGFRGNEVLGSWLLALAFILPPLWMKFDRDEQFIHDRILGTRLVTA